MHNKNPKSNSSVIREAEIIIEQYLEKREMREIENYKLLKEKYERLKIFSISIFLTSVLGILLNILHIY